MRCFFALAPDTATRAAVDGLRAPLAERDDLHLPPAVNLHLTLCFLGERSEEEVRRLATLVTECPFEPALAVATAWVRLPTPRRPSVLALAVKSDGVLEALAERLRDRLRALGDPAVETGHRFLAHLTVARVRRAPGPAPADLAPPGALPLRFDRLGLYESEAVAGGVRYRPIAERGGA